MLQGLDLEVALLTTDPAFLYSKVQDIIKTNIPKLLAVSNRHNSPNKRLLGRAGLSSAWSPIQM